MGSAEAFLQELAYANGVTTIEQQQTIVDAALASSEQPAEVIAAVVQMAGEGS